MNLRHSVVPLLLAVLFTACGTDDPAPEYQRVLALLSAGDPTGGITILDSLVVVHPDYQPAWVSLGRANRSLQNYESSVEAYVRAVELQPQTSILHFNLGIAYAFMDDHDHAFEWLIKAKESGTVNTNNVAASPAAANISYDPRYATLFPSAEEFADPFVETATILHEWVGEAAGDQFGWIARNIGDADGIADAVVSATTNNEGAPSAGKVYVFSGKSGDLIWSRAGSDAGGQLGFDVEAAGDVNSDGIPDVIAGTPYVNKAFVFSGRDGAVLHEITGDHPTGGFGSGVKAIGDLDGDGYGELLIGEPYQIFGAPVNNGSMTEAGNAYVFSGRNLGILLTLNGEKGGDAFGTAVSGTTVAGQTTFLIGAPNAGWGGRTYVYKGLSGQRSFVLDPGPTGSGFGAMFMSVVGDVDADGAQDVYVSDFADTTLGPSTGRAYVFSGRDGSELHNLVGESSGDGFGIGIADAGDVNADGHADLVIGAWQHAGRAPSGGKVYVYVRARAPRLQAWVNRAGAYDTLLS